MHDWFTDLQDFLDNSDLNSWGKQLPHIIEKGLCTQRYGDLSRWLTSVDNLPEVVTTEFDLTHGVSIGAESDCDAKTRLAMDKHLRELIPWRKGPVSVHGIHIDTEWRSDWKWDRLLPHIQSLDNKLVLDVGCGNGYHCLRMMGEKAQRVIGIDPSPRFVVQFYALKKYLNHLPVDIIPATLDDFMALPSAFDTVFSMGVLYHRPSPFEHLKQLRSLLKPGGELVLETLVIEGALGEVLVPEGRYAMMNNVWFLPSPDTMLSWLRKMGFKQPRLVDLNRTSTDEQRKTDWMKFHSLSDFLDPHNPTITAEGHPAPLRGIFVAEN